MPVVRPSLGEQGAQVIRSFVPARMMVAVRRPMLAFLSIVGLVTGGSIASVSAAERAVPGDLLYPIKLATEQTRLAFTKGRTDKLKLKTEFVGRRAEEIKTIARSDVSQKPERIKEAAEILRRDLDTVKVQLNEASAQEPVHQVAQAAKLIDQKSAELVSALRTVKTSVPDSVKPRVAEAETAAVTAGVRAVQVLLGSHAKPEAKDVVTDEELIKSIDVKVQGLQDNINDAAQKILGSTSSTGVSSSTQVVYPAVVSASSTLGQIMDAQHQLTQAKEFLRENKLDQASDKLVQTVQAVANAESSAESASLANASSSAGIMIANASGTADLFRIATSTDAAPFGGQAGVQATSTNSTASGTFSIPPTK